MPITFLQEEGQKQEEKGQAEQIAEKAGFTLQEEKELVERAKTDQEAFSQLYDYYFSRIFGYIFKRVGHRETVEDLVSEIFTKAFVNIEKFEYRGYSFGAWLYQIATNHLIDYYRKKAKVGEIELEEGINYEDEKIKPEEQVDLKQTNVLVKKVVEQLPDKYQEILMLKFFAELSNQEIARVVGKNPNHVGVMIFRGLKIFKKEFVKYV